MSNKSKTSPPHEGMRVLFADDEEAIQELMSLELPRMGHEVTVCPDGETAIAALEPIQQRYQDIRGEAGYLDQVLQDGKEKAEAIAQQTLGKVKRAMGYTTL